MSGLVFTAGGKLMYYSPVTNVTHEQAFSDVTHQAASYLSEAVRFDGEIQVNDVFSLLEANPLLLDIFAKLHAAAFLSEARKGIATPYSGGHDPDGIDYLELFFPRGSRHESRWYRSGSALVAPGHRLRIARR